MDATSCIAATVTSIGTIALLLLGAIGSIIEGISNSTDTGPTIVPSFPSPAPSVAPAIQIIFVPSLPSLAPSVAPAKEILFAPSPPSPAPSVAPAKQQEADDDLSSQLYVFVASLLADGGTSLQQPSSYQFQAYAWVEANYDASQQSWDRVAQRFALACFYYSTYAVKTAITDKEFGENVQVFPWLQKSGWLVSDDECTWYGLQCNGQGWVEQVNLPTNILTGSVPAETALLKNSLKVLNLESNFVFNTGDDGMNWLGDLQMLEKLNLAETRFEYDGIPPVIGNLVNLVYLDVSYCLFFGSLQAEVFANLDKLEYLSMGGNQYNSPIPDTVGQLPSLLNLYAEFTNLTGDLGFLEEDGLPLLFEVWIDNNPQLGGSIPTDIGDLTKLESLSLTDCALTGTLPTELGQLRSMQQMWFFGNQLDGDVPTELGLLNGLNRLEIEKNNIGGTMPDAVCDNVYPRGLLQVLEADCDTEITCASDCCTCCGEACATQDPVRINRHRQLKENVRRRQPLAHKISRIRRSEEWQQRDLQRRIEFLDKWKEQNQ